MSVHQCTYVYNGSQLYKLICVYSYMFVDMQCVYSSVCVRVSCLSMCIGVTVKD